MLFHVLTCEISRASFILFGNILFSFCFHVGNNPEHLRFVNCTCFLHNHCKNSRILLQRISLLQDFVLIYAFSEVLANDFDLETVINVWHFSLGSSLALSLCCSRLHVNELRHCTICDQSGKVVHFSSFTPKFHRYRLGHREAALCRSNPAKDVCPWLISEALSVT